MIFPAGLKLLVALSSAIGTAFGILFLLLALLQPRARPLRPWALGLLAMSAGNAVLYFRDALPVLAAVVLANVLFVVALVWFRAGALQLSGRAAAKRIDFAGYGVVVLLAGWLSWFTLIDPDLGSRIIGVCLAHALLAARVANEFSHYAQGRGSSFPANMLAGLWWVIVLIALITAWATLAYGTQSQDVFEAGPQLATLLLVRPALLIVTAGFTLWTQFRGLRTEEEAQLAARRQAFAKAREALHQSCDEAVSSGARKLVVAMLDVDACQPVTARHGRQAAEALCDWTAQMVRDALEPGESAQRVDIGQLAVLMPRLDPHQAAVRLDQIRRRVAGARCLFGKLSLSTTVSIGISTRDPQRSNGQALGAAALVALYAAQAMGGDRVHLGGEPEPTINWS